MITDRATLATVSFLDYYTNLWQYYPRYHQVLVKGGDVVLRGQAMVILEAVKMERVIAAPSVDSVGPTVGDLVDEGAALVSLKA